MAMKPTRARDWQVYVQAVWLVFWVCFAVWAGGAVESALPEKSQRTFDEGIWLAILGVQVLQYIKGLAYQLDKDDDAPAIQSSGNRALQSLWNIGRPALASRSQVVIFITIFGASWIGLAALAWMHCSTAGPDGLIGLFVGVGVALALLGGVLMTSNLISIFVGMATKNVHAPARRPATHLA
jgi:hypothetical protein